MSPGARGKPEDAVGHVVHRRDPAVARDGQHTRPQVEDQMPEEPVAQRVVGLTRRARRFRERARAIAADPAHRRLTVSVSTSPSERAPASAPTQGKGCTRFASLAYPRKLCVISEPRPGTRSRRNDYRISQSITNL